MIEVFLAPTLAIVGTLLVFYTALALCRRTGNLFLNPVLVSVSVLVGILYLFRIPYGAYDSGARYFSYLLGPIVVALGIPLHQEMPNLIRRGRATIISLFVGSVIGCLTAVGIASALGASELVARSLIAKSVTTPIAVEVTRRAGGLPDLALAGLVMTGIFGAVVGVPFLRRMGLRSRTALGLALGAASHVMGGVRAAEEGRLEAASAVLAISVMGIATALVAPGVIAFLEWIGLLGTS